MEKFESLRETEKQYFLDMVKQCKDSGATLIICQWCCLLLSGPSCFGLALRCVGVSCEGIIL